MTFLFMQPGLSWYIKAVTSWGMQIDWWLQPRVVCSHTLSDVIWHCNTELNSIQLHDSFVMVPLEVPVYIYISHLHFTFTFYIYSGAATIQF